MKICSLVNEFIAVLFAMSSFACHAHAERREIFYSGTGRILNLLSGQTSTQAVILVKTLDPQNNMLSEVACFQDPGKTSQSSHIYMKISGSTGIISDNSEFGPIENLKGTIALSGTPWNWNYLRFSMVWKNEITIEDVNFVVNNQLIARKQLFLPNGTPLQLWEIEMAPVSSTNYHELFSKMSCPASSK